MSIPARPMPTGLMSPSRRRAPPACPGRAALRSEEHTSELQSLMRNPYAVFWLKKKNKTEQQRMIANHFFQELQEVERFSLSPLLYSPHAVRQSHQHHSSAEDRTTTRLQATQETVEHTSK